MMDECEMNHFHLFMLPASYTLRNLENMHDPGIGSESHLAVSVCAGSLKLSNRCQGCIDGASRNQGYSSASAGGGRLGIRIAINLTRRNDPARLPVGKASENRFQQDSAGGQYYSRCCGVKIQAAEYAKSPHTMLQLRNNMAV